MTRPMIIFTLLLLSSLTLSPSFGPDHLLYGPRSSGLAAADLSGDGSPESILINPAALSLLNRRTVTLGALWPSSSATLTLSSPELTLESPSQNATSLLLAAGYPIGRKLVAGLLYSTLTDYSLEWPGEPLSALSGGDYLWQSRLKLQRMCLSASYLLSEKIALGLSVNLDKLSFTYALPFGTGQYEEDLSDSAVTITLGLRFQMTPQFSAGVTYTSAASWELSGEASLPSAAGIGLGTSSVITRPFSGPGRLSAGISYQFSEKIRFAASLLMSNWSELQTLEGKFENSEWIDFFGGHDLELNWKSTTSFRLGAEYQVNESLALRAGFSSAPSATPEKDRHPLLFSLNGQTVSLGGSLNLKNFVIDAAIVIPMIGESELTPADTSNWPGSYEASMIIPCLSVSYRF